MGLREDIQSDLAESFDDPDGLADAVRPVAGIRTVKGIYDPGLGGAAPAKTINTLAAGCLAVTWPRRSTDHASRPRM